MQTLRVLFSPSGIHLRMLLLAAALLAGVALSTPSQAQIACAPPLGLSAGAPQVQQQHIFCGEVIGGHAGGFHSRPGGVNPAGVLTPNAPVAVAAAPGVYQLSNFTINGAVKPLSTMFPDTCNQAAVIAAIQNAAAGAGPNAVVVGNSGPGCTDSNGNQFRIRVVMRAGQVRTAYPDY